MSQRINLGKPFRLQELFKKNCTQEAVFLSCEGQNKIASSFSGKDISYTLNFHQFKYLNLCFDFNEKLLSRSTKANFQQCKLQKKRSIKILSCWVSKILIADKKVHIKTLASFFLVSFFNLGVSTKSLLSNWLACFDWKINIFHLLLWLTAEGVVLVDTRLMREVGS